MKEEELFLFLIIIGFVLGIIGFSAITGSIEGAAVYSPTFLSSHTRCVNGQCIMLKGPGNSECDIDSHCYHLTCRENQCVVANSPGRDWCTTNSDCY
ncbi:MAG: hypothetical protein JSW73_03885 [Candidatus Woesearchaeota archaeon]|nr:MAG: hypothetical protein JSW73_03885 [Candidatus Woesearchaeota archaeon]